MISLYDWYKDAKGRTWCVVRIWPNGANTTVDILEVGAAGPVGQSESTILELIANGAFKKLKK